MKINTNIAAIKTLNQLNKATNSASKTMERLSSGLRINSAADDAAGLAISQKMDTQVRGLKQANRNAMDGISLIQTAEGALNEVHSMLQRMRELTVQAANGTYSTEDKVNITDEISALEEEITAIRERTEFNKKTLLNGSQTTFTLQVGANENQTMDIDGKEMDLDGVLKLLNDGTTLVSDVADANKVGGAITKIDAAIAQTSQIRSKLGAYQNRLEHTVSNLGVSEENITAALSRIQDADMAEEMTNYTQKNVLSQAATAMLAQANQRPQQVLQLLNQ